MLKLSGIIFFHDIDSKWLASQKLHVLTIIDCRIVVSVQTKMVINADVSTR